MTASRKYNPEFNVGPFVPIAIALIVFFFATAFINISAGLVIMVLTFSGYALFSLLAYFKTHNIGYFAAFLFQGLMVAHFLTVPMGLLPIGSKEKAFFFYFCGIVIGVWLVYLMASQKAKWKGRNVFELVARNVNETVNGYTERPRPAGKIEYTKSDLFGFADYLRKNLIAMAYIENDSIVFVPVKMGDEHAFVLGYARDFKYYSWIAFDYEGNVSSSLSRKDYLAYREEFSFDQLCDSMGKLFIEFMEYYKKGDNERIMHKLKSIKVGYGR